MTWNDYDDILQIGLKEPYDLKKGGNKMYEIIQKDLEPVLKYFDVDSIYSSDYLNTGFQMLLKARFPQHLTTKIMHFGNAIAYLNGPYVYISQGYGLDIMRLLSMIVPYQYTYMV